MQVCIMQEKKKMYGRLTIANFSTCNFFYHIYLWGETDKKVGLTHFFFLEDNIFTYYLIISEFVLHILSVSAKMSHAPSKIPVGDKRVKTRNRCV